MMSGAPSRSSVCWSGLLSRSGAKEICTAETAAIAAAGLCAVAASLIAVSGAPGFLGAGLAAVMFAIAAFDARHFIIPDELTVAALLLGFVHATAVATDGVAEGLTAAMLRGCVLALAFFVLRIVYHRLRGRQGIGLGDVKLAGVAGVWLDWPIIPIAIEIAALAALGTILVRHMWLHRPLSRTSRLPFGLFLAPAIWAGWLLETMMLLGPWE